MLRYDRVNLYTWASNLFLFLDSLFLFLAHRTCNSFIRNLFEWEREDESAWMCARTPHGTIWIGSRMLCARTAWRTNERIRLWSFYWWGCISRWVNMTSNFLMMRWLTSNLEQTNDLNNGSMMRAEENGDAWFDIKDEMMWSRNLCRSLSWEITQSTSEERWHDVRAHKGFHLHG